MPRLSVAGTRFVRSSDQSLLVYFDPPEGNRAQDCPLQGKALAEANENVRKLLQLLASRPIAGVRNLHPAYCSLLVKFDAQKWRHEGVEAKLREYLEQLDQVPLPEPHLVEIPVCYGEEFGPDLDDVAQIRGMTRKQVIRLHTSRTYLVYFLGFVPGFAYLGELPAALATPRHATPRRKVPAGSVGIAGNQTGVYPCETPGGWRLLGRTPMAMFRPDRDGLSLLSIGDHVRFKAISREQFAAMAKTPENDRTLEPHPLPSPPVEPPRWSSRTERSAVRSLSSLSVLEARAPGLLTTVQDLGREGFGSMGVSPSGAADPTALRLGNRLVGNPEGAAGLEMTLLGGTFVFPDGAIIALTGGDIDAALDGAAVPLWTAIQVRPGQTLRAGATRCGARCYLCVAGGIEEQPFLGSSSTHLLSVLGGHQGRALRKGDVLKIGAANRRAPQRTVTAKTLQCVKPRKTLRVTPGPQCEAFPGAALKTFYSSAYRVAAESNRMGLRLEGPLLPGCSREDAHGKALREMLTEGVSLGAVQITPAGLPIILFVEQQTTGGYPKIANVISADFSSLGQLRPRDEIRFEPVGWETARALLIEQEAWLASDALLA